MKEAIQKAIEGGYKSYYDLKSILKEEREVEIMYELLLDPFFWQALSKAMGWGNQCAFCLDTKWMVVNQGGGRQKDKPCVWCRDGDDKNDGQPRWIVYWHRFIDKLVSGGTAEEFFKDLIK